jgi:hypothetical protein
MGESILRDRRILFESRRFSERLVYRKGIGLIFPNQDVDNEWQHKCDRGRWQKPWEEFSFLFNNQKDHGIGLTGDMVFLLAKRYLSVPSGALLTALENSIA